MTNFQFEPIPQHPIPHISDAGAKDASKHKSIIANSLPASLSNIEDSYIKYQIKQKDYAQKVLTDLQKNIDHNRSLSDPQSIRDNVISSSTEFFKFNFEEHKTKISQLDASYRKRNDALISFMSYNNYTSLPTRADIVPWKIWSFVAALFLLESILNAFMFYNVISLASALVLTTSQSFINIGTSFVVGRWIFSNAFYNRSIFLRIVNYAIIFLYIIFITWMNLALGMYRNLNQLAETVGDSLSTYESQQWLNQAINPFIHLEDFGVQAAVVSLVGLCFAGCSVFKGFFADDPRPHYGSLYRGVKKDKQAIHDALKMLRTAWVNEYKLARASVASNSELARASAHEWSHGLNLIEKIMVDWDSLVQSLEESMNDRIKAYFQSFNNVSPQNFDPPDYKLFNENEKKKEIVFADAIQYLETDSSRRISLSEKDDAISKISSVIYEEIEKLSVTGKEELDQISRLFPSCGIGVRT